MPFKTRVTEMLGIEHPIIMGGMTGVGTPELAAAVSNAGGLGIIAIHNAGTPEQGRMWIRKLRSLTNGKPFGVNLTILPTMGPPPPYMEYCQVMIEENVKIVETAGSSPQRFVNVLKKAGIITIHKCVTIRHALSAERYGVDIISLDGFECAGHPGEKDVGNFVLQARGAQVLTKPYLCSGGIATGSQLAASLALGADGINLGTRICATQECCWPSNFKNAMIKSDENDTVLILRRLQNTSRVYKNDIASQVAQIEDEKGDEFQITDVMHLVNGKRGRQAEANNDANDGIWTASQAMGLIHTLPTCKQVIDDMIKEAEECITTRLNSLIVPANGTRTISSRL